MNFFKALNQKMMFGLGGLILGMLIAVAFGRFFTLFLIVIIVAGIFAWPLIKGRLSGNKNNSDSIE